MSHWFSWNADTKCELCSQEAPLAEGRLCASCEEGIVRLLRVAGSTDRRDPVWAYEAELAQTA